MEVRWNEAEKGTLQTCSENLGQRKSPQDWKDANFISIFKKGSRKECGNYRGISLLSIAGKIMARIILNRLNSLLAPNILPETQCGFRSGRSTISTLFSPCVK